MLFLLAGGAGQGCGGKPVVQEMPDMAPLEGTPIPADPQRPGDPQAGYTALVNNGYVSCGVPYSLYTKVYGAAAAS